MMKAFGSKLEDIERRVASIENKLSYRTRVGDSTTKDNKSTIGTVSPGFSSSYGNTATKNDPNAPDDKKITALNNKIRELEDEL